MPNWVSNVCTVVGPEDKVQEFIRNARGKNYGGGSNEYEFTFHQLVPLGDDNAGVSRQRRVWGIKWGARTNDVVKHNKSRVSYRFETAWDIGTTFYFKVSSDYPDLHFFLSASEEDAQRIRVIYHKGNQIYCSEWERFEYGEYPDDSDISEDDWYEQIHEHCAVWWNEYTAQSNHDEWVFLYCLENGFDWNSFGDLK